jgi:O-antigen/teichoic acid export membrane protein
MLSYMFSSFLIFIIFIYKRIDFFKIHLEFNNLIFKKMFSSSFLIYIFNVFGDYHVFALLVLSYFGLSIQYGMFAAVMAIFVKLFFLFSSFPFSLYPLFSQKRSKINGFNYYQISIKIGLLSSIFIVSFFWFLLFKFEYIYNLIMDVISIQNLFFLSLTFIFLISNDINNYYLKSIHEEKFLSIITLFMLFSLIISIFILVPEKGIFIIYPLYFVIVFLDFLIKMIKINWC